MPYRVPPESLNDHLKKQRADLGLLQKDVAEALTIDPDTLGYWEMDRTVPAIRMWPKIIDFLGYYPVGPAITLSDQLFAYRRKMGLSQEVLAKRLGVDEGTLAHWEHGIRQPTEQNWRTIRSSIEVAPDFYAS